MPDTVKKVATIDSEMEVFYAALGQLNSNIVLYLRKHPDELAEIINKIRSFICSREANGDCSKFGSDYQWSELRQACVRRPTVEELDYVGEHS